MSIQEARLAHIRIADAMHTGIITTDPTTPLRAVARLMADNRVHAIAIADPAGASRPYGFVSALDVAAAAAGDVDETAGQAAATEAVTVGSSESLDRAARLMVEHGVGHLVVIDAASGYPCGILSALDVAAAYAG
jgi:CBS domain-containing protein